MKIKEKAFHGSIRSIDCMMELACLRRLWRGSTLLAVLLCSTRQQQASTADTPERLFARLRCSGHRKGEMKASVRWHLYVRKRVVYYMDKRA